MGFLDDLNKFTEPAAKKAKYRAPSVSSMDRAQQAAVREKSEANLAAYGKKFREQNPGKGLNLTSTGGSNKAMTKRAKDFGFYQGEAKAADDGTFNIPVKNNRNWNLNKAAQKESGSTYDEQLENLLWNPEAEGVAPGREFDAIVNHMSRQVSRSVINPFIPDKLEGYTNPVINTATDFLAPSSAAIVRAAPGGPKATPIDLLLAGMSLVPMGSGATKLTTKAAGKKFTQEGAEALGEAALKEAAEKAAKEGAEEAAEKTAEKGLNRFAGLRSGTKETSFYDEMFGEPTKAAKNKADEISEDVLRMLDPDALKAAIKTARGASAGPLGTLNRKMSNAAIRFGNTGVGSAARNVPGKLNTVLYGSQGAFKTPVESGLFGVEGFTPTFGGEGDKAAPSRGDKTKADGKPKGDDKKSLGDPPDPKDNPTQADFPKIKDNEKYYLSESDSPYFTQNKDRMDLVAGSDGNWYWINEDAGGIYVMRAGR